METNGELPRSKDQDLHRPRSVRTDGLSVVVGFALTDTDTVCERATGVLEGT